MLIMEGFSENDVHLWLTAPDSVSAIYSLPFNTSTFYPFTQFAIYFSCVETFRLGRKNNLGANFIKAGQQGL